MNSTIAMLTLRTLLGRRRALLLLGLPGVLGAGGISIQQWSLAVTRAVVGDNAEELGITAAVRPQISIIMLLVVAIGGTWYAGRRLRSLRLTSAE